MKRIAWMVLGWLALMAASQAASFDCAKAATKIEKLICADDETSWLDERVSMFYKDKQQDAKQADSVKQAQKQWLKERNGCPDAACVKAAYKSRLLAFSTMGENEPIKLELSGKPISAKGSLAPGKRITYVPTPDKIVNMTIQIQSANNKVGFTVWNLESHLGQPVLGESRKPLLGVIKGEMEDVYLPNLSWQGGVSGVFEIVVENEGEEESSFTLSAVVQQ